MPLSPHMLLQASAKAKPQSGPANAPAAPVAPGDKAASFAGVFAGQASGKSPVIVDAVAKAPRDKATGGPAKNDVASDAPAAAAPVVADSGKTLPAESVDTPAAQAATDDTLALDPALLVDAQPTTPAPVADSAAVVAADPVVEAAIAASVQAVTAPAFDPEADPLDALPAVRLAMEQSGHVSASTQAQAKAVPAALDGEPTPAQHFSAGMASMLELQADKDSTSQGGEKAFTGLLDDGLKDLGAASSDTRVDDFASRLAALTQAATPKTANALPVNQPIAMHQSGWTEEVVNRVMYLSSANLKAAEIQLQPAELGRLDIRINLIPDQQTQVTFMSAHVGVREALDGQMHRLREMFVQQGMGQVDVNVSDQSRGSQEQAQQGQSGRTSASGARLDATADEPSVSVTEVAASTTNVIGTSAVDYYA
ncbi:flagellar hook-length control protein FliK [Pseudomonas sp. FW300-N1A1]|uniref:flagellar hook-length control protein FliK n=1 Tax=Pseudomonas sp. FW300-N1A1 TaxID=2075555 RepID=UPI000CD047FC|nr:flagellar hook-length control protein FliK [Pseudomonas sp. FW300-N1A1]POA19164.1 flagellar hook-length control protein FliK [Pseudomonas sp. FW300-N1A1]